MASNSAYIRVQLALVVIAVSFFSWSESGLFDEFQIKIVNNFTNEEQVSVHCYSGSDDRGSQTLTRFGQVYDFIYKPKFFESFQGNEFTCVLLHDEYFSCFLSFIPTESFLYYQCGGFECIWTATPDGIYLTDTHNNKDWLMYKWQRHRVGVVNVGMAPLHDLTFPQIWKINLEEMIEGFRKLTDAIKRFDVEIVNRDNDNNNSN
ncbi:hypothetical protein ACFE04_008266 [Oxalis oulophora]